MTRVRHVVGCSCNQCNGVQGVQGPTIIVGPGQGGARGTQGTQGTQGAIGTGIQGTQGPIGPGGGAQGTQGTTGTQGVQGSTGSGTQGVQGSQGEPGTQGISGTSLGTTDDLSEGVTNLYFTPQRVAYVHTQGVANSTWVITHNLHFYPNITVQDSAGNIVEGEITYTNSDSLTVTFATAFSGEAYLS